MRWPMARGGWFLGMVVHLAPLLATGCGGPAYTADDAKAAEIGTRNAAELFDACRADDAGTCRPSVVRARSRIIFCASEHALTVHGTPFDGGVPCPTAPP